MSMVPKPTLVPPQDPNIAHALLAIGLLFQPGDVFEIRALEVGRTAERSGSTHAGYFNVENHEAIARALRAVDGHAEGVYLTLNRVNPALLARAANQLKARLKNATADHDIIARRWLYIDADAIRPAAISSTDGEHQAALDRAFQIREFLDDRQWPEPIYADSGNGSHLLYRLPVLELEPAGTLVKACLHALAARFNDAAVKVDEATFNAARICKFYGTLTRKGDPMPDRPHRRALIITAPDAVEMVPVDLLEALAAEVPPPVRAPAKPLAAGPRPQFDIDAWLSRYQSSLEIIKGPESYEGGRRWHLRECLFNREHEKPVILQLASGAMVYRCLHESCKGNDWPALRRLLDPNYQKWTPRPQAASGQPQEVPPGSAAEVAIDAPQPNAKAAQTRKAKLDRPTAQTVADLLALPDPDRRMLIETILPTPGAMLLGGSHKSGKTVFAVQAGIAIASGHPFLDYWRVMEAGAVIIVEQDDPAGDLAVRDYLKVSPIPVTDLPIFTFTRLKQRFGFEFCSWLESEIDYCHAKLVILDSYTALRPHRRPGLDIVKTEQEEMALLDALGKRTGCTILILTHDSKSSWAMDWSDKTAGTFAMGAAVIGQMHVTRFRDLATNAPERLIQIRGRHIKGTEAVVRFREATLDYEMVLEGGGASLLPELRQIHDAYGEGVFSPKELSQELGISRGTAHRIINRLAGGDALFRVGHGEYRVKAGLSLYGKPNG